MHAVTAAPAPAATTRAAAIAESIQTLADQLAAGNSAALTNYLATMGRFYSYSFGNQLLIATQCPDAQRVAGFHTWKSLGRNVKKGAKAIRILAPMVAGRKDENATDASESKGRILGFRRVCVFDVAQTEGKELPSMTAVSGDAGDTMGKLLQFAAEQSIAVESRTAEYMGSAEGLSYGGRIALLGGLPDAQTVSVLAHELAHELMHKGDQRTGTTKESRELEAEAVAFVVGRTIGLEVGTASADYIRMYNGDAAALAESLEAVSRVSAVILNAIAA